MTYDLPSIKSWAQLLERWQINSIVTLQTGTPFSAVDFENDTSLRDEFSDRWNVIGNPTSIPNFSTTGQVPVDRVLSQPDFGNFGNSGRNTFRGPKFRNWDFSLVKTWKPTERVSVQLRGELFNVLNRPNFANPAILFNNDLGFLDTFGLVTATPDVAGAKPVIGTGGPRSIQFGLKIGIEPRRRIDHRRSEYLLFTRRGDRGERLVGAARRGFRAAPFVLDETSPNALCEFDIGHKP